MTPAAGAQPLNLTDAVVFERELKLRVQRAEDSVSLLIVDMGEISGLFARTSPAASHAFLCNVAKLLQRICRDEDRIYRIGDYTFGVVLTDISTSVHLQLAAEKIIRLHDSAIRELDAPYNAGVHIGIASCPEQAENARDLFQKASVALESSRSTGDPYFLYSPDAVETLSLKWDLQEEVGIGITAKDFEIYYQPQVSLATGKVTGAEALLRWRSESHGNVPPDVVIAVAREIGRISELTQAVLTTALRHSLEWPDYEDKNYRLAINLDPQSLKELDVVNAVASNLSIWGGDSRRLTLEITEAALVSDSSSNFELMNKLRELGIGLSIDDFGTGFSSLSYFKKIPASELKIDRSFVRNILESEDDRKLVETIIELAHRFDMEVVAEGVETSEQADFLRDLRCDIGQGFYFSAPMPQDEFCAWLEEQ